MEKVKVKGKKHLMNGSEKETGSTRIGVLKTYKMYIGGEFPRTESGRYFKYDSKDAKPAANICLASRKDVRNAVVAARKAQSGWASKTAYNRSQILYRIAENLESRKDQLTNTLIKEGLSKSKAQRNVETSVDRLVYYAGWCDKYQQVFSSVNPVAARYFNFSVPEPTGVVACVCPESDALLSLISTVAPVITGGNSCVVLASEKHSMSAIEFAEVVQASDMPGGVINILTGRESELLDHFASHMDINALIYCNASKETLKLIEQTAASNVKRVIHRKIPDWFAASSQNPYFVMDTQEIKTTWHPIGN